jgi:hypothetical protein
MNKEQLRKDIECAINKNSAENGSDTPDFILADYLMNCLDSFNLAVREREKWYSKDKCDTVDLEPPADVSVNGINFHKSAVTEDKAKSSEGCSNPSVNTSIRLRWVRSKFDANKLHNSPEVDISDGYAGLQDTIKLQFLDEYGQWNDVPIVSANTAPEDDVVKVVKKSDGVIPLNELNSTFRSLRKYGHRIKIR